MRVNLAATQALVARQRQHMLGGIPRQLHQRVMSEVRQLDEERNGAAGTRHLQNIEAEWVGQLAGVAVLDALHEVERWIGQEGTGLDEIGGIAKEAARAVYGYLPEVGAEAFAELLAPRFDLAVPDIRGGVTWDGIGQRFGDDTYWRRNLTRSHTRQYEYTQYAAGAMRKGDQPYISRRSLELKRERWRRAAKALENAIAVAEEGEHKGQEFSLAELAEKSVANLRVRYAEMMVRIKGLDALGAELGHEAAFVTWTAPGCYHPTTTKKRKRTKGKKASYRIKNPAWNGSSPKETAEFLGGQWAKARAAMKRAGLKVYGMRITEPHADGCPHWHMLVFGDPLHLKAAMALMQRYACKPEAHELRDCGPEVRFKFEMIDPAKGSATAYITKYLSKNLDGKKEDGLGVGDDFEGGTDTVSGAERVRAWASLWGIRQFQFFGDAPVGVWRELRRLNGEEAECAWLDWATQAADKGDWQLFVKLLGGPGAARKDMPVRLKKEPATNPNRYGEESAAVVRGVESNEAVTITRRTRWAINWRAQSRRGSGGEAATGAPAPTWTRVNNCTENLKNGSERKLSSPQPGRYPSASAPNARSANQRSGAEGRAAGGRLG